MLKNEKILIIGPASQVGFPIARELGKDNEVYGLARFSNAADRTRLETVGVKCLQAHLATDDFACVLNLAVVKSRDGFAITEKAIGSITVDLTRMYELVGTTVGWRDGLRRMIRARHPEAKLQE